VQVLVPFHRIEFLDVFSHGGTPQVDGLKIPLKKEFLLSKFLILKNIRNSTDMSIL